MSKESEMRNIRYELNTTRAWYRRQVERGKVIAADDLWVKIRSAWPGLTEEEHEKIFQACEHAQPRQLMSDLKHLKSVS